MALQFQPPPSDLINAYLNRPSPGQQASDAINQGFQMYAKSKDDQQKEALAQQQKDIEMAKGLAGSGQDFTDAYKQVVAARTAPAAAAAPGTSLIDRAKAFFTGSNTGKSPDAGTPAPMPGGMPGMPTSSTGTLPSPMGSGIPAASPMTPLGSPLKSSMGGLAQNTANMQATMPPPVAPPPGTPLSKGFLTPTGALDQGVMDAYKKQHGTEGIKNLDTQLGVNEKIQGAATKLDENSPKPFDYARGLAKASGLPDAAEPFIQNAQNEGRDKLNRVEMKDLQTAISANASQKRGSFFEGSLDIKRQQLKLAMTKFAMDQTGGKSLQDASKVAIGRLGQLKRAEGVLDQIASQNDMATRRQAAEGAISTVKALVGSGVATDSQINEFIPTNLKTKYRDWKEFLTSDATQEDFSSFRQEYQKLVDREKGINQDIVKASQDFGQSATDLLSEQYPTAASHIQKRASHNALLSPPAPGDAAPPPASGLVHLSTKELMDLRKKMTAHQSNGN